MFLRDSLIRLAYHNPEWQDDILPLLVKSACVIAVGTWEGERCLFKNRDRNYVPDVKVRHVKKDGVEMIFLEDIGTGWVEGLNEFGIGIVNSALLVGRDEAEKKIVNTVKKSQDGPRIRKALTKRTLDEAVESLLTYKNGIKGHTFVSDKDTTKSIEMTKHHDAIVKTLAKQNIHVRTNHGFGHSDAGYTEGDDYVSSVTRRNRAMKILRKIKDPRDIAPKLTAQRTKDPKHPNNVVRDTDNMSTTSQSTLNLKDLSLNLYLIDGKVKYKGLEVDLPEGYEPKCKFRLFEYDKDGTPKKRKI